MRLCSEHAVDVGPPNAEPLSNGRRAELLRLVQSPDLGRLNGGLASLVDATGLCSLDAFELAFAVQVSFELGEQAQLSHAAPPDAAVTPQ